MTSKSTGLGSETGSAVKPHPIACRFCDPEQAARVSKPGLPQQYQDIRSAYFRELLCRLAELIQGERLAEGLAHSMCSVNASYHQQLLHLNPGPATS